MDRLKERIRERTRKMVDRGLVEEVQAILDRGGFGPESGRAIGYRQIIDHLAGAYDLQEATERIINATWRFAKRQMTWYRRFEQIRWFDVQSEADRDRLVEGVLDYFTGPA
jgi:tRNA dimethylallyltransferase